MNQKILKILLFSFFLIIVSYCKKEENKERIESKTENRKTLFVKYPLAIYKLPGSKNPSDWVATLSKAEEVTLISEEKVSTPKGEEKYYKVKIAGDKIGFAETKHFAKYVGVVIVENSDLKQRPTITSLPGWNAEKLIKGSIVFSDVIKEEKDGNWYEVDGTIYIGNGKYDYFKGWIKESEITTDLSVVADAVLFERALILSQSCKPKEQEEGLRILNKLSSGMNVISELAQSSSPAPPDDCN